MRALLVILLASCTPEIAPGAYLCGPDGACPEGLACNHAEATCDLPTQLMPFSCVRVNGDTEPDNVAAEAFAVTMTCNAPSFETENCMLEGDTADWLTVTMPTCAAFGELEARLSFPISFAELGFELWDLDTNAVVATDTACKQGGGAIGELRACIDIPVIPGKNYGIKVYPTGEGTCDGTCSFNRYSLRMQLAAPE
jgi:hypothetical protein